MRGSGPKGNQVQQFLFDHLFSLLTDLKGRRLGRILEIQAEPDQVRADFEREGDLVVIPAQMKVELHEAAEKVSRGFGKVRSQAIRRHDRLFQGQLLQDRRRR